MGGMKRNLGFTLIELLIVITIIGILTGILLLVINPVQTQRKAKDGIIISHVGKLGQAIEAYQAAEGSYPSTFTSGSNGGYVKSWPVHPDGQSYTYSYNSGTPCLYSAMSSSTSKYIKWRSADGRTYKDCTNADCTTTGCVAL